MPEKAIVVGAGIVGLAAARALSVNGYEVTVVERSARATGASIRNFGMIWPVGQPQGELYDAAIRSRQIWSEAAAALSMPVSPSGSLHLAYEKDEWEVLQELYEIFKQEGRPVRLMQSGEISFSFGSVQTQHLLGGLFSGDEMIVDPRQAIASLPGYLAERYGVSFRWNRAVTDCRTGAVKIENDWVPADRIVICSGQDFETLYPALYRSLPLTRCKLQMMRFAPGGQGWKLGTSLCGGLSLIHYPSFKAASSLAALKQRYVAEMPEYLGHGIHVMVSQNAAGELTVGDSHEYGDAPAPFDSLYINELIIAYLKRFVHTEDWTLTQTWHGIYPKLTDGNPYIFARADEGVYALNGVGGAGMTLSFGLAESLLSNI